MTPPMLAVTGATGFVGAHFLRCAHEAGCHVRALARREQPAQPGVTWITGSLDQPDALDRLVGGADAVVHIAGAINAPDRAAFAAVNAGGTLNLVEAALRGGLRRFVHVSSLAARAPELSDYGWSKARAEAMLSAAPLAWTIVRPPAVFGPGDRETLELFRMTARGLALLPPHGRASWIEVSDLCRLLVVLADTDQLIGDVIEPDDGRDAGWEHRAFVAELGRALGRPRVRSIHAPRGLLRLAAHADVLVRGGRAKLTPDRASYLSHPDWTVDPARRPPSALWQPQVATPAGLAATAAWYRAHGWLK